MLRCCAGICGGGSGRDAAGSVDEQGSSTHKVMQPIIPPDEDYASDSFPSNITLDAAPPGTTGEQAVAWVTPDFQRNTSRLLVLVPSPGAPPGAWDTRLDSCRGSSQPLLRWALANRFAAALFRAKDLEENPAQAWDLILKGSPARLVFVVVASGSLPTVKAALAPVHALLFSRFRTVCVRWSEDGADDISASALLSLPTDLRIHLRTALVQMPPAWADMEAFAMHQILFQLLIDREERFSAGEARKYWGFQGMKENDIPGLRRMSMETRIKRLDRDRNNDELAQILRTNEEHALATDNTSYSDDEPGVD